MSVAPPPDPGEEKRKRQRARNLTIFFALLAFVVLIYGVTIVKIKAGYGP
jgi:hypothetical protein